MSPKDANEWIVLAGTAATVVTVVAIYIRRIWERLRTLEAMSRPDWFGHFGNKPAKFIRELLNEHGRSITILEATQGAFAQHFELGIYICDARTGECLHGSVELANLFGLPQEGLLGYRWLSAIVDEDKARVKAQWEMDSRNKCVYRADYRIFNSMRNVFVDVHTEARYFDSEPGIYVGYVRTKKSGE